MSVRTDWVAQASRRFEVGARGKQALRVRFYAALVGSDVLVIAISFLAANLLWFGRLLATPGAHLGVLFAPSYLIISLGRGAVGADIFSRWRNSASRAVASFLAAASIILLISFYLQASGQISRAVFAIGCAFGSIGLTLSRLLLLLVSRRLFGGNAMAVIYLCDGVDGRGIADSRGELVDAGAIGLRPDLRDPAMLDAIGRYLRSIDRVVIACVPERRHAWAIALKGANVEGEIVVPEINALGAIGAGRHLGNATLHVAAGALHLRHRIVKRAFDLSVSIFALVLLAPLIAIVALAIKLESPGPVFFIQTRLGRGNRLFSVYKFRSMYSEVSDAAGDRSTARGDKRVTKVGRIIRALSIDEIAQIINVLKGDMSLVGPRPHALGSLAGELLFWEIDDRYWHRHAIKPGITGLAQVRGFRGATEQQSDLINRLQADLEYLQGWNIWRDVHILLSTLRVVRHQNAF